MTFVRGTRIGIEAILLDYLDLGLFAEDIALRYPSLTLEQVYAAITYYWHNRQQVDAHLEAWKADGERRRREQELNPSPAVQRIRALIRQRDAESSTSPSPSSP